MIAAKAARSKPGKFASRLREISLPILASK
jgi:hypothetical protein